MNKIFHENIDAVCTVYKKHVLSYITKRLNFTIAILSVYFGKNNHSELNNSTININGIDLDINLPIVNKKTIANLFLATAHSLDSRTSNPDLSNLSNQVHYNSNIAAKFPKKVMYYYVHTILENLIGGKIVNLKTEISRLKNYTDRISTEEKKIINHIFDYSLFFHKKSNPPQVQYHAHILAYDLRVEICPYCNRDHITSVLDSDLIKVIGPTFDHFLSQKDYPFLALSFYNLIPSCYNCNSQLKHEKEFDFENFLYPYEDSYEALVEFKVFQNNAVINSKLSHYNDITIELSDLINKKDARYEKLYGPIPFTDKEKGNLNVFQTREIYNSAHRYYAKETIEKFQEVSKYHIESVFQIMKNAGKSEKDIYKFYFGTLPEEKDFNKRPLSRFTRDIVKQLNKIYSLQYIAEAINN